LPATPQDYVKILQMKRAVRRLPACLPVAVVLAWPAPAAAHLRTGTIAVDVAARVTSADAAFRARVYLSDRALHVAVRPGHTLVLLGYLGEPFARIGPAGVSVDRGSATAQAVDAVSSRRSLTWHDDRLKSLSPGRRPVPWSIPVIADGRRASIAGVVWRPRRPPWWPWTVVALLAAALGAGRRFGALGVASVAAALCAEAGLALGAYASAGTWIATLDETAFALAGLWLLVRGPRPLRLAAAGGLGLLGLAVGLSQLPVFLHPIVLSALPAGVARGLVAIAVGAGVAAAAGAGTTWAGQHAPPGPRSGAP
jgi:hypothetical protein